MALQTPSSTTSTAAVPGKQAGGESGSSTTGPALLTLQGFLSGLDSEKKKRPKLLGKQFKKLISPAAAGGAAAAPSTPRSTTAVRISANSPSTAATTSNSLEPSNSSVQVLASQELDSESHGSGVLHAKLLDSTELFSSSRAASPLHATILLSQESPRELESISSKVETGLELYHEYSGVDETVSLRSSKTGTGKLAGARAHPVEHHVKELGNHVITGGKLESRDQYEKNVRYSQKPPTAQSTRLSSPRTSIEQQEGYKSPTNLEIRDEQNSRHKKVSQTSKAASLNSRIANPERDMSSLERDAEYALSSWVQAGNQLSPISRKISIPKSGKDSAFRHTAMQLGDQAPSAAGSRFVQAAGQRDHELSRYTQKLPKLKTRPIRNPVHELQNAAGHGAHAMEHTRADLHLVRHHEYDSGADDDDPWDSRSKRNSRTRRIRLTTEHDNHVHEYSRVRSTPAREDEYSSDGVDESLSSHDSRSRRAAAGKLVRGSYGDKFSVNTMSPRRPQQQEQHHRERLDEYSLQGLQQDENVSLHSKSSAGRLRTGNRLAAGRDSELRAGHHGVRVQEMARNSLRPQQHHSLLQERDDQYSGFESSTISLTSKMSGSAKTGKSTGRRRLPHGHGDLERDEYSSRAADDEELSMQYSNEDASGWRRRSRNSVRPRGSDDGKNYHAGRGRDQNSEYNPKLATSKTPPAREQRHGLGVQEVRHKTDHHLSPKKLHATSRDEHFKYDDESRILGLNKAGKKPRSVSANAAARGGIDHRDHSTRDDHNNLMQQNKSNLRIDSVDESPSPSVVSRRSSSSGHSAHHDVDLFLHGRSPAKSDAVSHELHETGFSSSHVSSTEARDHYTSSKHTRARSRTLSVTSQKEWRSLHGLQAAAAVRYPNTRHAAAAGELVDGATGRYPFADRGRSSRVLSGTDPGQETDQSPRDHRSTDGSSHLNYSPDESSCGGDVGNNLSVSDMIGNVSRSASSAALMSNSGTVSDQGAQDNWVTDQDDRKDQWIDKGRRQDHGGGGGRVSASSSSSHSSFTTTSRVPNSYVPQSLLPRSKSSSPSSKFQKRTKLAQDANLLQPSNSSRGSFKVERPASAAPAVDEALINSSSLVPASNRQAKRSMKRRPASSSSKLVVLLGKYGNKKGLRIAGLQQATAASMNPHPNSSNPSQMKNSNDTRNSAAKQEADILEPAAEAERQYESLNSKEAVAVFQDEVARMMMMMKNKKILKKDSRSSNSSSSRSNKEELTDAVQDFFTGYMRLHSPIYLKMLQDFFTAVCLDCYKRPLVASAFKIHTSSKVQAQQQQQQQQPSRPSAAATGAPGPRHSSSGASLESECACPAARSVPKKLHT